MSMQSFIVVTTSAGTEQITEVATNMGMLDAAQLRFAQIGVQLRGNTTRCRVHAFPFRWYSVEMDGLTVEVYTPEDYAEKMAQDRLLQNAQSYY